VVGREVNSAEEDIGTEAADDSTLVATASISALEDEATASIDAADEVAADEFVAIPTDDDTADEVATTPTEDGAVEASSDVVATTDAAVVAVAPDPVPQVATAPPGAV
jgi:hypothetical protein